MCAQRPEEGAKSPGSGVLDGCKWLCRHKWLGPLQEQQGLSHPSSFLNSKQPPTPTFKDEVSLYIPGSPQMPKSLDYRRATMSAL